MNQSTVDRLRVEAINLSQADRVTLARELVSGIEFRQANLARSAYHQRMHSYAQHAWSLAANSLTADISKF